MSQIAAAEAFAAMHVPGQPIVLFNIWDAGTARAVVAEGARAVATGSLSVAAAHGYSDGEAIPLELVETIVTRIVASVDVPVTVDFEGGYAVEPEAIEANVRRIIATGAIGLNFEDQVVGTSDLYPIEQQVLRLAAVRRAGTAAGVPIVINARTDLFLKQKDPARHAELIDETIRRAEAYAEAGSSCFFVPGLYDLGLIADVCRRSPLPVNVIALEAAAPVADLTRQGVARISFGPRPYRLALKDLATRMKELT